MTKEKFNHIIMKVFSELDKYEKIIHVTHGDDADGIGCEIAMTFAFSRRKMNPNYEVIYSHAGNKPVMENIKNVASVIGRNGLIIISDLSFFKEGYDYLKENLSDDTDFVWIDHHIGDESEDLKEVFITNGDYHSMEELEDVFFWDRSQVNLDYSPICYLSNLLPLKKHHKLLFYFFYKNSYIFLNTHYLHLYVIFSPGDKNIHSYLMFYTLPTLVKIHHLLYFHHILLNLFQDYLH